MPIPRIVIAGTQSGVGKTTVSLALMAGFKNAGYRVQAFKVGPDYIDPGYHQWVTGRPSHNLDGWLMGKRAVQWLFQESSQDADIAIIEGVMGLFDGASGKSEEGSTAQIAKLLHAPVVLVLDAQKMARSAAAVVWGYKTFDPEIQICGVILNKVASQSHFEMLRDAIEETTKIQVLGALFRNQQMRIPERHLGLKTAGENKEFQTCFDELTSMVQKANGEGGGIDIFKIVKISQKALQSVHKNPAVPHPCSSMPVDFCDRTSKKVKIGIARDEAFSFYYEANLDFLRMLGAELIPFSPVHDESLPEDLEALYLGGGFPEVHAEALQKNENMRIQLKTACSEGLPIYAECGGLMYLTEGIQQENGKVLNMAGILPGIVHMTEKLQNFGYAEATLLKDCFLGYKGENFRGHEFHYSLWGQDQQMAIHEVKGKRGAQNRFEGYASDSVFASYIHCHFLSYPERALALVKAALRGPKLAEMK